MTPSRVPETAVIRPERDAVSPTQAQIEAEMEKRLKRALKPFAAIEVPPDSDDGTWVAKTIYCNNQVTAHSVREARAALTAAEQHNLQYRGDKDSGFLDYDEGPAALTAAAEADEQSTYKQLAAAYYEECLKIEAATIERCAQVADEILKQTYDATARDALLQAIAAIRALKDKA